MKKSPNPTIGSLRKPRLKTPFIFGLLMALMLAFAHKGYSYCTTGLGGASYAYIDSVSIVGTTLNNASPGYAPSFYTAYPATGNTTASLMQGATYTLYNAYGGSPNTAIASLWIDYNQNGVFEASEWTQITTNAATASIQFTVPLSATTGTTGLRIRSRGNGNPNGASDACSSFGSGETEDYTITIVPATPCSGTPVITGITPAGPISSCAGATLSFSANVAVFSGYTYQWETAAACTGPWTAIAGATNNIYTFSVTGNAFYHVVVTCSNSSQSATSGCVQVTATSPTYATIPYLQDFESWTNYCSTSDVPSSSWTNQPSTGNNSWRRNDQGSTASWYSPTSGLYLTGNPYVSGSYSARFHTYGTYLGSPATQTAGNLDLYIDCSSSTLPKQLYFWYNNYPYSGYANDSLTIWLSTNGGSSFTQLGGYDTTTLWNKKSLAIPSSSAQTIIRFSARRWGPYDYSDILVDSVYVAPPCTGQPVAGTITPASLSGCPGSSYTIIATGTTMAGNMTYQWIQKPNGATTWSAVTGGSGANTTSYTTPSLFDSVCYRMVVTCNGSGLRDTTAPVCITVARPTYGALPFTEDFESWSTRCYTTDIPTPNWANFPATGNPSWRRNDQGASASWTLATSYMYTPAAMHGSYSARFHSGYTSPAGTLGKLDLFVDCSTATGTKELQFYYINTSGTDSLRVQLSTNGGATFTTLGSYNVAGTWTYVSLPVASNAANTVIRFAGVSDYGATDVGLDYVRVLNPCTAQPVAGTVTPVTPCSGADFQLALQNGSQAAGLTYQWQYSASANGPFVNVPAGNQMIATGNITASTWFRCIVNCTNSSLADTSVPYLVNLAQFYYCYCGSTATYTSLGNIGNVSLFRYSTNATLLNNGSATPAMSNSNASNLYSDFRYTVAAPALNRDSVYKISVAEINSGTYAYAGTVGAYIDYNRNGVFDANEKMYAGTTTNTVQQVSDTFRIPDTAQVGLTGMRVIFVYGTGVAINPCGTYSYGETEDYLVNIEYSNCDGPANAGTAFTSDTSMCAGYTFTLADTSHQKERAGLTWDWEMSDNFGSSWTQVTGSVGADTVTPLFTASSWYRLRMICSNSNDTTYSNIIKINIKPAYMCYCYSIAIGPKDTSDIGAVTIDHFVMNTGGPHLLNPVAIHGRTDYTDRGPIELFTDSTYDVEVFQTMPVANHADARLTMFIDFNNNLHYDIPDERIQLAHDITTANDWYLVNRITIPHAVITDVPTGLRLILNNNVGPNSPSDDACGTYTSGETEDYTVIFRTNPNTTGISNISGMKELGIFPNPTTGKFTIQFNASKVYNHVTVRVSGITGQEVIVRNYTTPSAQFHDDLDMSSYAKGVYYVEIIADGERMIRKLVVR